MKKLLILILSLSMLLNAVFATGDVGKTKKSNSSSAKLMPYINRGFELIPSIDIQILIANFIKLYKNFQFLYIPPNNTTNNTNKP